MIPVLVLVLITVVIALPACTSAPTFQTLADAGQTVYSDQCAVCHGYGGQPENKYIVPLWGPYSTLGTYHGITLFTDAQTMLNYISRSMPLAGSGSLSHQQYVDLLCYILVQGNQVSPSSPFDENRLSNITLK